MRYFIYSEPGFAHENEDVVEVRSHPADPAALLCALADGQGGQSGGGDAARTAVAEILRAASECPRRELLEEYAWYPAFSEADAAVCNDAVAGHSTLIAACVTNTMVCGVSCGDSQAYLVTRSGLSTLTEYQRKNPPFGSGEARPVAFAAKLPEGWKLLIVSDGVWRFVGGELIAHIATEHAGQAIIDALRDAQLSRSGGRLGDDFTIILVESD